MAWTALVTFKVGQLVDAALLNAQNRDNLLALSTHVHSGAAGDGSALLSGVDSLTFDHIGDPSAPGAAKLILYTKSGGVYFRDGAAGAVTQLSDENHTH